MKMYLWRIFELFLFLAVGRTQTSNPAGETVLSVVIVHNDCDRNALLGSGGTFRTKGALQCGDSGTFYQNRYLGDIAPHPIYGHSVIYSSANVNAMAPQDDQDSDLPIQSGLSSMPAFHQP